METILIIIITVVGTFIGTFHITRGTISRQNKRDVKDTLLRIEKRQNEYDNHIRIIIITIMGCNSLGQKFKELYNQNMGIE